MRLRVAIGLAIAMFAGEARAIERIATGFALPVFLTEPPGDTSRVFIAEQHTGAIRILRLLDRVVVPTPFLTVSGVSTGIEQGLLGLAFDPGYATNGYFYVYYTNPDIQVVRYHVSSDPGVADAASATPVLTIPHPADNHNGGWIAFGPDGDLYIGVGDGGGAYDDGPGHTPGIGNGQDLATLLGKILRIDVRGDDFPLDPQRNYSIPPTNPFRASGGNGEIWAYGLRNPWRSSFDRETRDLYIGDVGQYSCEEIDVQPAASRGGENYGWRLREGLIQEPDAGIGGPKPIDAVDPIFVYPHAPPVAPCAGPDHGAGFTGYAIVGGYVYRGPVTALRGRYFFADWLTAHLWSLVWDGTSGPLANGTNFTDLTDHSTDPQWAPDVGSLDQVGSFGEDAIGNLYVLDLDGDVFRLPEPSVPVPLAAGAAAALALSRARARRTG
ncbi:MAG TPA: PQQ-dependent sugar dehydrogenase [Myxococcota bacterium]|nr:PQQ-dependent sugar dehydrogenase [Myxococcota bacterium]